MVRLLYQCIIGICLSIYRIYKCHTFPTHLEKCGHFFTVSYMKAQRIVFFGWRESLFSVLVTEPVSWLDWGVSEVLSQRMVTTNMVPSNLRRYLITRNA